MSTLIATTMLIEKTGENPNTGDFRSPRLPNSEKSTPQCSNSEVTVTWPEGPPEDAEYWKYGPTTDDAQDHWYTHPASLSGDTETFSLTDGGAGDHDLEENGVIGDPAGIGAPARGDM